MGWRSTSMASRRNSGSSSKNKTPLWAREISPGIGVEPPPVSPAADTVWWGERNGRVRMSGTCFVIFPEMEYSFVVSMVSSQVISGRMEGSRLASILLPAPGGPIIRMLCPPAAAISNARLA